MVGDSNDETNFSHKSLLTHTQVSKIRKVFANGSSANIKFSKTELFKMIPLGGYLFSSLLPLKLLDSLANSLIKSEKSFENLFENARVNAVGVTVNASRKTVKEEFQKLRFQ